MKPLKFTRKIRDDIITGVFVLAPIGAVTWIVIWIWNFFFKMAEWIPESLHPIKLMGIENPIYAGLINFILSIIVFILILAFIAWIGVLSRYYLGKRVLIFIRKSFLKLPVINTVYSTLEQLLETFSTGKNKNFRKVVQIEYPRKGISTLALVTGEKPNGILTVFVPTTPNPTSGFYLMIAASETTELSMSVEDALKEIISMGLVKKNG